MTSVQIDTHKHTHTKRGVVVKWFITRQALGQQFKTAKLLF